MGVNKASIVNRANGGWIILDYVLPVLSFLHILDFDYLGKVFRRHINLF